MQAGSFLFLPFLRNQGKIKRINNHQFYIDKGTGAFCLIGKPGENPARSRHCNGERCYILMPLGKPGKAGQGDEPESGDLPVPTHAVTTYER